MRHTLRRHTRHANSRGMMRQRGLRHGTVTLNLVRLPRTLNVVTRRRRMGRAIRQATVMGIIHKSNGSPSYTRGIHHRRHRGDRRQHTRRRVPSTRTSNTIMSPRIRVRAPHGTRTRNDTNTSNIRRMRPRPTYHTKRTIRRGTSHLYHLYRRDRRRRPTRRLASGAIFALTTRPRRGRGTCRRHPYTVNRGSLKCVRYVSSPTRLVPRNERPLFCAMSVYVVCPTTPYLRNLTSGETTTRRFIRRPLKGPSSPRRPSHTL